MVKAVRDKQVYAKLGSQSAAIITDESKVQVATTHDIPFLATGGRHGYTATFGKLRNGLATNLSQLNSIHIDVSASTVTVGGGVRFGDIIDPLYEAGFELRMYLSNLTGIRRLLK